MDEIGFELPRFRQELKAVAGQIRSSGTYWRYANGLLPGFGDLLVRNPQLAAALAADAAALAGLPSAAPAPVPIAEQPTSAPPELSAIEIFRLAQLGWEWSGGVAYSLNEWVFELVKMSRSPREISMKLGIIWKSQAGVTDMINRGVTRNDTDRDRHRGPEEPAAAEGGRTAGGAVGDGTAVAGGPVQPKGGQKGRKVRAS